MKTKYFLHFITLAGTLLLLQVSLFARPAEDTPTQVMLSIGGDPSTTYSVTWWTS